MNEKEFIHSETEKQKAMPKCEKYLVVKARTLPK